MVDVKEFRCHADQDDENEIVAEGASVVHGEPPGDGNAPPKVDSEVEILQEKVTKQIVKEGHGQKPSKYATCFCKYHTCLFLSSISCWYLGDDVLHVFHV